MAALADNLFQLLAFVLTAARSLGRNKLRSFLSVLGVVFGVMAVMTIICIGQGARQEVLRQVEQLGTRNIYLKQLPLLPEQQAQAASLHVRGLNSADLRHLQMTVPEITKAASLKELDIALMDTADGLSPQIAACSANYAGLLNLKVTAGRFIRQSDINARQMVCVLGNDVAEQLGARGGLNRRLRISDQLFTVIGRLERNADNASPTSAISIRNHNEMILLPMGAQEWLPAARPQGRGEAISPEFSEIIIEIAESDHVVSNAALIRRTMARSHQGLSDYQIVVPLELLDQSRRTNELFNLFLGAIAGISLLVGGIGIMNIMLAAISERKKEIGIRRAVGATRAHIVTQFLAESTLLTLSGGFIGVTLGAAAAYGISLAAPWHAAITLTAVFLPLAMSLLVGLFFGLYPAWRAACVDPIQALKYE